MYTIIWLRLLTFTYKIASLCRHLLGLHIKNTLEGDMPERDPKRHLGYRLAHSTPEEIFAAMEKSAELDRTVYKEFMDIIYGDGIFIPEPIRQELHAHYAAHLRDGGYDVPELLQRDSGVELKHELKFWLWLAKSVMDRRERVQEFLIRVGKDESKELVEQFDQLFRHVTHMHGVAGSAGEAMQHLAEQEELSQRAQQITQELAEEELAAEAAKQEELRELFERFRANHG